MTQTSHNSWKSPFPREPLEAMTVEEWKSRLWNQCCWVSIILHDVTIWQRAEGAAAKLWHHHSYNYNYACKIFRPHNLQFLPSDTDTVVLSRPPFLTSRFCKAVHQSCRPKTLNLFLINVTSNIKLSHNVSSGSLSLFSTCFVNFGLNAFFPQDSLTCEFWKSIIKICMFEHW